MMIRPAVRLLVLCALVTANSLVDGACSKSAESNPAAPDPETKVDTFSGNLVRSGATIHTFTVSVSGAVAVGLTDVAPVATLALGVGVGTWDGTNCTVVSTNDNARMGTTALSGTANAGNFCLRVYDSGTVPEGTTVTYTLQVGHS
jgi:hypothetical protein